MENSPTILLVVALALADGDGRWLMHRRPADKHHGGLWEFPGGKIEPGEVPEKALIREIREELGVTLAGGDLVPVTFAAGVQETSLQPIVILLYSAARWEGEPDALEGGAIGWFTPAQVEGLAKPPLDRVLAARLFAEQPG